MKKIAALLFFALALPSATIAAGRLDLFADENHLQWCIYPEPLVPYQTIDCYFFARPPASGFAATECKLVLPDPSMMILNVTYHPNVNLASGDWLTGMNLIFDVCMNDPWVLCTTFKVLVNPPGLQEGCQVIELCPRDDSGFFGFAICDQGFPPEDAEHFHDVHVNCDPCPPGPQPGAPPIMLWAEAISRTEVQAVYNEAVTMESAGNISNYSAYDLNSPTDTLIISGVTIVNAQAVRVVFSDSLAGGVHYWLSARNIADLDGDVRDVTGSDFGYLPDLVPMALATDPDPVHKDSTSLDILYAVKNEGLWDADSFRVSLWWSDETTDPYLLETVYCTGLGSNQIISDTITITIPETAAYRNFIELIVDDLDQVFEGYAGEHNNGRMIQVDLLLPDLITTVIDVVPDNFRRGCEDITVYYKVRNDGFSCPCSFYTSIYLELEVGGYIEKHVLGWVHYPALSMNGVINDSVSAVLPFEVRDNCDVVVRADHLDHIIEMDEYNNIMSVHRHCFAPRILDVQDVRGDCGGFVSIYFARCSSDGSHITDNPIAGYELFRRSDPAGDDWEVVGWVPAENAPTYSDTVPTIADSSAAGIYWSAFYIRVVRPVVGTGDTVYYYSCPDSGYSVDNEAVATLVQSYGASWDNGVVTVSWLLAGADRAFTFDVYRQRENDMYSMLMQPVIDSEGLRYSYVDDDIEMGKKYRYRVYYLDKGESRLLFETDYVSIPSLPLTLYQNYPNPFNPSTSIKYYLPADSPVELDIYDVTGTRVTRLINEEQGEGFRFVVWNGCNDNGEAASSGIYFYRLRAGKEVLSRKMILLR